MAGQSSPKGSTGMKSSTPKPTTPDTKGNVQRPNVQAPSPTLKVTC